MSPHSSDIILRAIAQAISTASGEEFFRRLVAALCQTLEADFAFIGRLDADDPNRIHVMAVCVRGEIGQNFSYHLHGTPCENVVGREPCHYPRDIRNLFPEDHMLAEMGIESYVGHPLFGSAQQPLGLLAVMHSQAMPDEEPVKSVLRICASRAAAEIERIQAEEMLRASETNLRSLAENADEGILVNRDGRHVFANRRIAEMLGYRIDELLQTTIKDIVHPDEQERVTELFRKRMTGHHVPNQYETVFVAKDGKRVPMEISAAATVWQGKPAGLVFLRDITERKQAEAEARKLSSAIEQTADSVIITDRDGIIQYVNPAYEETTGFSREETLGKKPNIVKSGKQEPAFYQHLWETIRSGQTFRDVFINRRKNGELFYEQKTITPLKDENGNITHFVSTGKDITAHVLAENENRRMQTFLNSVVENLPNMLFVKDAKDLRFVRFNKAAEELLGYSRDEMLGKSDYDFFTKEEADFFTAKDKQVLNSGQFHDIPEESIHTRHKGVRILHTKKIPILDEAGKPLYLLGISEDITDRKKTEGTVLRMGRILDKSSNEIYVINAETLRFVQVNQGARRNLGYSAEELAHMTPLDIKPDFTREKFDSLIAPLWRDDTGRVVFETVHRCKDGSLYPVEVQLHLSRAESPPVFVAIIQDITERQRADEALRASALSLANAQRIAHLGNWDWNIVTNELHWSDEIYRIFGLTPQQFDATYEAFLSSVHPDDRQLVMDAVNKAVHARQPYSIDHRIVLPDGTERVVHEQAEVTFDENGKAIRMIGTVQDVTERRQVQERLHNLAYYDSLTGLPNRQQVNDSLYRAMLEAESRDRLVAVMFLDLDRFKNINDTLGHDVGDALLKEVAVRLKASLRPGDSISRLGGDEFILILGNIAHINDVTYVAEKILDQFIPPFRIAGRDLFISPSVGITLYPFDDSNPENLLKNADIAMYRAKELGRNNFQFYAPELNIRAVRRLELETGLRRALEKEEFILHYQPLVNMQTGKITGMEALLRWQHPEYGLIPPMDFIPLAEETGLIVPIGEWVLRTACAQIKTWHATGFPAMHVAVNLSSVQLQQKNFAETVKRTLQETGLEPGHLDLELTESLLMHDMEAVEKILKELKTLGVLFSLDDFGTGYSSLSYLKRFPIDFLKIDRSFVRDIIHDQYGAGIVRAIIVMAHTLGIKVIAEGVESGEQLNLLREEGCDVSQGYYCSEPLATETFTDLLKDWQAIRMGKCSIKKASGAPHKKKGKSTRRSSKKKG